LFKHKDLVTFKSSNSDLTKAFDWAKSKALSYAHDASDPVGYWYEAALPSREAFCMRDVSHQAIGAEILGLTKHNENMFQSLLRTLVLKKTIVPIGKSIAITNQPPLIIIPIKTSGIICQPILM
jgi:hypothetical protein